MSWPIIVVTGANSGIGLGICQRFLLQLSQKNPSDAQPRFNCTTGVGTLDDAKMPPCEGLTLILACRSEKRGAAARVQLYEFLDAHIHAQKRLKEYDGHAEIFRKNLKIEVHILDLADMHSVFRFADEMSEKYPYISHLICNAGVWNCIAIDYPKCLVQTARNPVHAVTAPTFYIQGSGEKSVDNLGWVWQCNVFGHYALWRSLQPLLLASKSPLGSRVIWMSSLTAGPVDYDPEDWQLIKSLHGYECSKFQVDLLSAHLDLLASEKTPGAKRVRHFVAHPGVVLTPMTDEVTGGWLLKNILLLWFYLARILGSEHHNVVPLNGAIVAVHLAIVSLCFIPTYSRPSSENPHPLIEEPLKFGSETSRWGANSVGFMNIKWKGNEAEGERLLSKCETLYQSFLKREGKPSVGGIVDCM